MIIPDTHELNLGKRKSTHRHCTDKTNEGTEKFMNKFKLSPMQHCHRIPILKDITDNPYH